MFGFGHKKKKEKDEQVIIGTLIVKDKAVQQATAQADKKFYKPDYDPQTRKSYYDDPSAHKAVKKRAFLDNDVVKDPYTNEDLVPTIKEAKIKYNEHWQEHLAESDHKDSLNKVAKRAKKNPWVTTDDVKDIANSEDNFQVISRRSNQTGGKGGCSQKEWSQDADKMRQLSKKTGESPEDLAERVHKIGDEAEKINNAKLAKTGVKNAVKTAHSAGKTTAAYSGGTAAAISGINNVVMYVKGEKTASDALKDVSEDSAKAAVSGYMTGAGLTAVNHTLTSSSSKFLIALGENNVAGKVITTVAVTGDTIVKWGNDEISMNECLIELGDKGCSFCGAYFGSILGETLIPIPVVGSAVGSLIGGALTSNVYNHIICEIQNAREEERRRQQEIYEAMMRYYAEQKRRGEVQQLIKVETENAVINSIQTIIMNPEFRRLIKEAGSYFINHIESERIIAEYVLVTLQLQEYRRQLQECIDAYFTEYRDCFDSALNYIDKSLEASDYDAAITGTNQVTMLFGKQPVVEGTEDFRKKIFGNDKISL